MSGIQMHHKYFIETSVLQKVNFCKPFLCDWICNHKEMEVINLHQNCVI